MTMRTYGFHQVDVFGSGPLSGNPLAVVLEAHDLSESTMASFARWTNLSETVFLLRPNDPGADYRARIFTPFGELPFAGHPTLGACAVWLAAGGQARDDAVVQECGVGLVPVRRDASGELAFRAPPLLRTGAVESPLLSRIADGLGVDPDAIVDAAWADNGPGWIVIRLGTEDAVTALRPDYAVLKGLNVGVIGLRAEEAAVRDGVFAEVRAFCADDEGKGFEDPVTGSLNAALGQWLIPAGSAPAAYVITQGRACGRAGRVRVRAIGDAIWVGGGVTPCIRGTVSL
jgi:PhzF family phenazine biosynthesis protein